MARIITASGSLVVAAVSRKPRVGAKLGGGKVSSVVWHNGAWLVRCK
jgi:hypothetical protein